MSHLLINSHIVHSYLDEKTVSIMQMQASVNVVNRDFIELCTCTFGKWLLFCECGAIVLYLKQLQQTQVFLIALFNL